MMLIFLESGANFVPIGDPACTHVVVEHSITELPNETASKSLQVVKQEVSSFFLQKSHKCHIKTGLIV